MTFPVVVKHTGPRHESIRQIKRLSSNLPSAADLREAARTWTEPFGVVVQEYLPDDVSEDWFVHGYCNGDARVRVAFTGRKLRSWPPRTGATACAYVHTNQRLLDMTTALCAHRVPGGFRPRLAARPERRPLRPARLQPPAGRPVPDVRERRRYRRAARHAPGHVGTPDPRGQRDRGPALRRRALRIRQPARRPGSSPHTLRLRGGAHPPRLGRRRRPRPRTRHGAAPGMAVDQVSAAAPHGRRRRCGTRGRCSSVRSFHPV